MFTYIVYRIFKKNEEVHPSVPHYNKFFYYIMGVIADIILVMFIITGITCLWKYL